MDIINYEDYQIYEDGRVFSKYSNRFLKPIIITRKDGYKKITVTLYNNGKRKTAYIARLLVEHYKKDEWDEKLQVDHIDTNSTNNNLNNLRMVTRSQNGQNKNCQSDNKLGIKNIVYRKDCNHYEFKKIIDGKKHRKTFKTLEEAIKYKDEFINKQNNIYIKK